MERKKLLTIKNLIIIGLSILFLICMANIAEAVKVEKVEGKARSLSVKVTADKDINKILVYKKDSKDKFILFYKANPLTKEFTFTIPESKLSTESETHFKIAVEEEGGNRYVGEIKGDKLDPYPSMNPEETAKPSWTPVPIPTKPTPSIHPSEQPGPSGTDTIDSIKLNKNSVTLAVGQTDKLTYTVSPEGKKPHLVWRTDANEICSIEADGTIKGVSVGEATISIKADNGVMDICMVSVKKEADPSPAASPSASSNPSSSPSPSGETQNNTNTGAKIHGGQAIAEAAVSIACTSSSNETLRVEWPDTRLYDDRTKAYVDARESLIEGHNIDPIGPPLLGDYASCDIGTATAVRYSGVDKNFEFRTIPKQWEYLKASDQWNNVGTFTGAPNNELKPGDILINSHHIMLYCGNEVVKQKYPNSDGELYEAGFWTERGMSYYPRLVPLSSRNSDASSDPYTIFRNVNWDKGEYNKFI